MNKKVLSCALMGATVANSVLPALASEITYPHMDKVQYDENGNSVAEVHEEVDVTTDSTSTTNVYAELGKEFLVTIPKSLTLDGTTKKGAYTVEVEGDIAGTDVVKVVPDETFALKSTGLNDVTANIEQDKTEWGYDEILEDSAVIGNGEIDAQGLTAGAWEGTFNFNINLEEDGTGTETESKLTLSADDVAMGISESVQVNAYLDGELANDKVEWTSDNENITVTDGLVETKASAQVGDTATVTVTAEDEETLTAMANVLSDLGIATVASAEDALEVQFTVTIVDMAFTSGEEEVTELDIKPNESKEVEVTIIPASAIGTVNWSTTATSGINLVKNGNTVTVKVAEDMETGKSYNLIATYGNYSKEIQINIVADHVCNYENEEITKEATCKEAGIKTLTCECGKTKTEEIPVDPDAHNFENGTCTECNAELIEIGTSNDLFAWNYSLDENNKIITLNGYSGSSKNVTIYGKYLVNGIEYNTTLKSNKSSQLKTYMFFQNKTIETITFKKGVKTGEGIGYMFYACTSLTAINGIENLDTSNLKYISETFMNCSKLESINLSGWDTSKLQDIGNIFCGCSSLKTVNFTGWNTSNITSFCQAFSGCTSLITINGLENFNTSKVKYMQDMFKNCSSLTLLDLRNWKTSNVENMTSMFEGCSKLSEIKVTTGKWNSSQATITNMFKGCKSSNVTYYTE